MSDVTTRGIRIRVESQFEAGHSDPDTCRFVFAYHVQITNTGDEVVQLIDRTWLITAGDGRVERVHGPGVVGEQPVLVPGATFRYSSFCPLPTALGTMHGHYGMQTADGETFEAEIGAFVLAAPQAVN